MSKVTIIIPNYNGLHFLKPCLASLKNQTFSDFSVLVVDNGSSDGSAEWLRENQVPAIFLAENTGFAAAANLGIRAADSPYVILLNNDTEAAPQYVEALVKAIQKSPRIFSVSPKMVRADNPAVMDDAGDLYSVMGWGYQRGVGQEARRYDRPCEVFSACAGGAIYRRSVFDEIGMFDEKFFAYLEDIDLGYRAKMAGYHNRYCPKAVLKHVGSGTSGSRYNSFKVRLAARNNVFLIYKNMPALQFAVNALPVFLGFAVKYFYFEKMGFGKDYAAGVREGLLKRRELKKAVYGPARLTDCFSVEWELITGAFTYFKEFSRRQFRKTLRKFL